MNDATVVRGPPDTITCREGAGSSKLQREHAANLQAWNRDSLNLPCRVSSYNTNIHHGDVQYCVFNTSCISDTGPLPEYRDPSKGAGSAIT
jgi:hypothetical protein